MSFFSRLGGVTGLAAQLTILVALAALAAPAVAQTVMPVVDAPEAVPSVGIPQPLVWVGAEPGRDDKVEIVQVQVAYVEMRSGPGRGYPVFYVAKREEWLRIELRHTDWYQVRTANGKVGWVQRGQLENTVVAGGDQLYRNVVLGDYLNRRVELGAAWGRFKSEPMIRFWTAYRMSDTLSLEGSLAQVQGVYSGSTLWHVDLMAEPWSDQRLSPYFAVGVGQFKNIPNQSLVESQITDAKLADMRLGLRWHLTDRFVLRLDGTLYTAFLSQQRTGEYRAYSAGLSFFF